MAWPGRWIAVSSLGLSLACGAAGCNLLGAMAYKFGGAPAIPAKYAPPKTPMVVLVENSRNPATLRLEAQRLSSRVTDELDKHQVAPLIDPSKLNDLRRTDPTKFNAMAVTAVGRAVGAEQVVVVDLVEFNIQPDLASETFQGLAEARVRVVDVASGETRWPLDVSGGYPLSAKTSYVRPVDGVDAVTLSEQLQSALSSQIARLFYEWKADSADGAAEKAKEG
jgi:hypothetical protein